MSEKAWNNLVFVGHYVRHNLLLLPVDQEAYNFAKVAGQNGVDWFFVFSVNEFEKGGPIAYTC